MDQLKLWVQTNIDKKIVYSTIAATVVLGVAVFAINKSGIGAAKKAAAIATGKG